MAHFYGTLKGQRGEAARLGTKLSGLKTIAASRQGAVRVYLWEKDGRDWCEVALIPWQGRGVQRLLYYGAIDGHVSTWSREVYTPLSWLEAEPTGKTHKLTPSMNEVTSCVICGKRLSTSRDHVDTCGHRCYRTLLERQRSLTETIIRDLEGG